MGALLGNRFPALRFLEISEWTPVETETLKSLVESSPLLRLLCLGWQDLFDDSLMKSIGKLRNLAALRFNPASAVTVKGMRALSRTNSPLAYLEIVRWPKALGIEGFSALTATQSFISRLRVLRIRDCHLGNELLDEIAKFTQLEALELSKCYEIHNDLSLKMAVGALVNLRAITLTELYCVSSAVIEALSLLPKIDFVNLSGSGPYDAKSIAKLQRDRPACSILKTST